MTTLSKAFSVILVIAAVLVISASPGYSYGNDCGCRGFSGYAGYWQGNWNTHCVDSEQPYPYFYNPYYNE